MTQALTIELPDEVFGYVSDMARKAGQSPETWVGLRLQAIVPTSGQLAPGQLAAARAELATLVGAADLGYPTGADNEQIDRDLAREYANTHEEER